MPEGKDGKKISFGLLVIGIGLMVFSVYLLMDRISYFRHWRNLMDLPYYLIKYIFPLIVLFILGKEVLCRKYWAKQVIIFISAGSAFLGFMKLWNLWEKFPLTTPTSHRVLFKVVIQIIVGISCLYFLTRAGIKEQFNAKAELPAPGRVGIKPDRALEVVIRILGVTAILLGLGAIIFFLFSLLLSGGSAPGSIFYLLLFFGVAFVIAGVNIFFFRNWGRNLMLILCWLCGIFGAGMGLYWKNLPFVIVSLFILLFILYFFSLVEVRKKFR